MNANDRFFARDAHVDSAAVQPLPNSRKIYVEGSHPDVRVPMREIAQGDTPASFGAEKNPALVVYDTSALSMPSGVSIIVADIVIAYPDTITPLSIDFDASSMTMIGNQGGTLSATQGKGTLAVAGATINPTSWYPQPTPVPQRRRSSGH